MPHLPRSKKPPLTHFLAIPLVTPHSRPQLQSTLSQFAAAAAAKPPPSPSAHGSIPPSLPTTTVPYSHNGSNDDGAPISPKALRPVGSIHFTIGVMSLPTAEAASRGAIPPQTRSPHDIASRCCNTRNQHHEEHRTRNGQKTSPPSRSDHLPPRPIRQAHRRKRLNPILYTAPHPAQPLHAFSAALKQRFTDAGLMLGEPPGRSLLLHATLVNTVYARAGQGSRRGGGGKRGRFTFDARPFLSSSASSEIGSSESSASWASQTWASDFPLPRLSICEMGAHKIYAENHGVDEEEVGKRKGREGNSKGKGEVIDEEYTEVFTVALPGEAERE